MHLVLAQPAPGHTRRTPASLNVPCHASLLAALPPGTLWLCMCTACAHPFTGGLDLQAARSAAGSLAAASLLSGDIAAGAGSSTGAGLELHPLPGESDRK